MGKVGMKHMGTHCVICVSKSIQNEKFILKKILMPRPGLHNTEQSPSLSGTCVVGPDINIQVVPSIIKCLNISFFKCLC